MKPADAERVVRDARCLRSKGDRAFCFLDFDAAHPECAVAALRRVIPSPIDEEKKEEE